MRLEGETEIAAGRERAWVALTDPHFVAACMPGQPLVEYLDERNLRITAQVGNGFMRTTATVEVEITELAPPERARATATAAVMASPVAVTASLEFEDMGREMTRARWSAEVTLGGMLVGFAGMVAGPIEKGVAETLACLKARIEAGEDGAAGAQAPNQPAEAPGEG